MEKEKGAKKHDLFITDLWEFDFPYHDQFKPQVLDFVASSKPQEHINQTGNPSLNSYGGDELSFDEDRSIFSFFKTQALKLLKEVEKIHDWDSGEWDRLDPWLNVNRKGNFNPPHVHPGNDYSGCYYASFPENSGLIHFLDPRPQHRFSSPNPKSKENENWYLSDNPYDTSLFTHKIKEGKVVIFPSWLTHYVDPNPTDSLRISIPFNAKYTQYGN
jgi:uncharacterized protein (TIGR02466 family)|tara:strand:- start:362 stop:1009 length:648 start_codon:yes stop_codon:yes gene_type:complete